MTTEIYLADIQTSHTVPGRVLPAVNYGEMVRRNKDVMRRLDNLEATVKANKEYNDRWLEESYEESEKRLETKLEANRKWLEMTLEASNKRLEKKLEASKQRFEKGQERLDETINILLEDRLTHCQETLKNTLFIRKFETFDRILQAWNDRLFAELSSDDKWILRNAELGYITKLLEVPIDTGDHLFEPVSNALGLLSAEEYNVANAILPILSETKRDCIRTFGWNRILHTAPTIDEGIADIEQSTLEDKHKATLIAAIGKNPKLSGGNELFLPNNRQTKVGNLEKRIQCLTESLASRACT